MIKFGLKSLCKIFDTESVCVTGMRGTGKDVLFGNVIARRKTRYVSNLDYGGAREALRLADLDMGGNSYKNFLNDMVIPWDYPYSIGADIYISDVGVYLPSQHCSELNRLYPGLPSFLALSRQISKNNVHINVQNLNRAWDKVREQSNVYLRCTKCFFLGPLVFLTLTYYDKAESCQNRVAPCRVTVPLFASREAKLQAEIYRDNFFNSHGTVKEFTFIFFNRSHHDTYYFGKKMEVSLDES